MAEMGRPPVGIDRDKLEGLMAFNPTLADTAAFFKCSESTIGEFIKDQYGITFQEFRSQRMIHTKLKLVDRAIRRTDKSDVMLIFALKNLCGWTDKLALGADEDRPIRLNYDPAALKAFVEEGDGQADKG